MTRFFAVLAASIIASSSLVSAQTYPSRPITMLVPLAPGGSTDTVARIVAEGMRPTLGQPVIVENLGGAGGTIAVGRAVRSAPDGYTILIGQWGTNMATGAVYNLPFDLLKDLEPIGLMTVQPFVIVGRKDLPPNNLKELIAWLKAHHSKALVGTAGVGAAGHIAGVLMQTTIGSQFEFIPYRSAGLAMQDLVGGRLDMDMDTPATSRAFLENGSLKGYAVTSSTRSSILPDIPTVDEAGLPGFYFGFWHGLWVPKGTPKDVITKINLAMKTALADPATRKRLGDVGQEIYPSDRMTPAALAAFQKAEIEKWWPVIKNAGIKAQ